MRSRCCLFHGRPWRSVADDAGAECRPASASVLPLPDHHHIYIDVSNDDGSLYGSGPGGSYYMNADGGGCGLRVGDAPRRRWVEAYRARPDVVTSVRM